MVIKVNEKHLVDDKDIKEFKGHYYKREQVDISNEDEMAMWRWQVEIWFKISENLFRLDRAMTIKGAKLMIEEHIENERGGQ